MTHVNPDFWNDRFGGEDFTYGREPNDFLREEASRIPKGRVLCLAEGEGRNAVFLAGLGHDVTAIDFSDAGLEKTARLAKERNVSVKTIRADLSQYDFAPDAYEGVVMIFGHFEPKIREHIYAGIRTTLVSGGVYLSEVYRPKQLEYTSGGPKSVEYLSTLAELEAALSPAMKLEIGREVERDIREGGLHGGMSATVQIVARKI